MTTPLQSTRYTSLCQTFRVTAPEGVSGVFVSKLGLYFRKKSDSLGVQVFLVRLTNGLPDVEKAIQGSLATKDVEDITVSADGTSETQFIFPQLVFLNAGESYGFVVQPIGNSPDYELWVGELGRRDVFTDKPIGSNPLVETAYYSGNQQRFADLINQDVKFVLYRARYTSTSGTAALRNTNTEVLRLAGFSPITGQIDIRAGDHVFGWSNSYANSLISGTITEFDPASGFLYLKNSTGNFTPGSEIIFVRTGEEGNLQSTSTGMLALGTIANATSNGLFSYPYHAIVPRLGLKKVPFTDLTLTYKGAYYNGTKFVQDVNRVVDNNNELEFNDRIRFWLGETEEKSVNNDFRTGTTPSGKPCTNSSIIIEASMSTDSNFISPVIDLTRNNVVLLRNIINANTADEHTRNGKAKAKYVSKVITLEDQMEAEDLKIYITANKPANTEIHVYTKVWNAADPHPFDSKVWSKMVVENVEASRQTNAPDEYLEYTYSFANTANLAGNAFAAYQSNNSVPVVYYSANSTGGTTGGPFYGGSGFDRVIKKFAVKIVLTSDLDNEYLYPKVNDLRVIALQM